jgi:hypothetical protein
MYHDLGVKIGLYFSPSEVRALDEQAELFRTTFKTAKGQGGPEMLPAAYRKDAAMQASWKAHQKLYWKHSIGVMTNYPSHRATADAERTLVSEKDFERADAALHDFPELRVGGVVELRHAHVEREIARRFSHRLIHPEVKRLQGVVLPRRTAHFDQRSRASDQGGL